jgi:hypothetical protein
MAGLNQLQVLDLSGNQLLGSIPASCGPSLKKLLLTSNALAGKFCAAATMRIAPQLTAAAAAAAAAAEERTRTGSSSNSCANQPPNSEMQPNSAHSCLCCAVVHVELQQQ